jgi:hypothetical protein
VVIRLSDRSYRTGEPDLKLAGFSLWVWGRQFPDSNDYWDGNWLNIDARVEANGAVVKTNGPCLRTTDIERFGQQLEQLYENVQGTAKLDCLEPNLSIKVTCDKLGAVGVVVDITPDHITQKHQFIFSIDQSYLPETMNGCGRILASFPVKGTAT